MTDTSNRYAANRRERENYSGRAGRFAGIALTAGNLAIQLSELDVLSRDDLEARIQSDQLQAILGSLIALQKEAIYLKKRGRGAGRGRDLAEERWISELADIYENVFKRKASVWGSGTGPKNRRGDFYRLLE